MSVMQKKRFIPEPFRSAWKKLRKIQPVSLGFSYENGIKFQRFLLSKYWVQNLFFPELVRVLRRWTALCSSPNVPEVILGSLMSNTWSDWREKAMENIDIGSSWLKIQGLENIREILDQGKGIILVSVHATGTGLIRRIIKSAFHKNLYHFSRSSSTEDPNQVLAAHARRLIELQNLLQCSEIIAIAGDGVRGKTRLNLPFYGYLFPFRSGFAELALRSGAAAVPMFIYFDVEGRITVEFCESILPSGETRQQQSEEMVRQYAALMTERWPRLLPSMRWHKLKQILEMSTALDELP